MNSCICSKMEGGQKLVKKAVLLTIFVYTLVSYKTVNAKGLAPEFSRPIISNRIALVNEKAELLCKVKGSPKPYVEWYHNGTLMQSSDRVDVRRNSIFIKNVQKSDSGIYNCKAENDYGELWGTFTFKVFEEEDLKTITHKCAEHGMKGFAPRFRRPILAERIVLLEDSTELVCKVTGKPDPFIVWYHNGRPIQCSDRVSIRSSSVFIKNVQKSDSGFYSCKAQNVHGEIWGNFTVTVLEDAGFVVLKKNTEKCDGNGKKVAPRWSRKKDETTYLVKEARKDIQIACNPVGHPRPNITWFKNDKQLDVLKGKYKMKGWKLTIYELTMKDQANYTCVLQNECGSIQWTYTLEVVQGILVAPIIDDIDNVTVLEGQDAVFTCMILVSHSQPLLQWQSGIDDPQYLTIKNATNEDEGWYTCLVANSVGLNYRSAWLNVLDESEVNQSNATMTEQPIFRPQFGNQ